MKTVEQYFGYFIREKTSRDKEFNSERPYCICTIYNKNNLLTENLTYEEVIHDIHTRVKQRSGCDKI